jgi:tetratricopeptide (TPR) repeat protein
LFRAEPTHQCTLRIARQLLVGSALVACSLAVAQHQPAAQRELGARFGLTPAQARAVFDRLDANADLVGRLAKASGVRQRVLRAIALELGARNPGLTPDAYVRLIQARAADAAAAKMALAGLQQLLSSLDPGGTRARALAVLEEAQDAFDSGRLEAAEASFARLASMRGVELAGARSAWLTATDLQARSAELRGDTAKADRILAEKSAEISRQRETFEREQWNTELRRAVMWYDSGNLLGKNEDLQRAIRIHKEHVLPLALRHRVPLDWATTQNSLGNALATLGERERGTARLDEAVHAYQAALHERTRELTPLDWAGTQNNLGNALAALGKRDSGTLHLDEAVRAYRSALLEQRRESVPLLWATTQNNLGNVLTALGEREDSNERLQEAAQAFRAALQERTRERVPLSWAATQNNLGNSLAALGERETDTANLEEAVNAFREALQERTSERAPLAWAGTQNNLGNALATLGGREGGTVRLEEAVQAYRLALREQTRERVPLDWAGTQGNLGAALKMLGERGASAARLEEALQAFKAALTVFNRDAWPAHNAALSESVSELEAVLARWRR